MIHQHRPPAREPLAVEWPRSEALRHQGIVHDRDVGRRHGLAVLADQERRAAIEARARRGHREAPYQAGRRLGIEDDRDLHRLALATAQPAHGPPRRLASHFLRRLEVPEMARGGVPEVPLHVALVRRHGRHRQGEGRDPEASGEPAARGIGHAALTVVELRALRVPHAGIGLERRRLRPPRPVDLLLDAHRMPVGVPEAEVRHVAGQRLRRRQPGVLVAPGHLRQAHALVHEPGQRSGREIRRRRRCGTGLGEDAEGAAVLAGVLEGLHGPQPHLHGLELLLDHEGVGLDGAPGARAAQEVLEPIEHLGLGSGGEGRPRHPRPRSRRR